LLASMCPFDCRPFSSYACSNSCANGNCNSQVLWEFSNDSIMGFQTDFIGIADFGINFGGTPIDK